VPKILVDEIEKILKDDLCMYTSKADFVTDGIRRHLEKTKKEILDERRHQEHLDANR